MSPLVILLPRKGYYQHFGTKIAKIVRCYCHDQGQYLLFHPLWCMIPITLVSEGSRWVVLVRTFAFPVQIFKAKSVNLSGISQSPGLILYFGWQISKNLLQMGIFQDIRFSIVSVKYGSKVSRWKSCKCRGGKEQVLLPGHKWAKSGIII